MKWIYLGLSIFTGIGAICVALYADRSERPELLKPCITASAVNFGIFCLLHWAQRGGQRTDSQR